MNARIFFFLTILSFGLRALAQERLTLLFAGDLMQHRAQIDAASRGDGYCYDDCFRYVKEEISKVDLAIGNLEVTLAGRPYSGYPAFSAPDEYLHAIKEVGFDVLLTANNHCLDKGWRGLERTLAMLDSLCLPHAGTYRSEAERHERYPLLVEKNGFRVVFLNYTYGTNGIQTPVPAVVNRIDREQMRKDILAARRMHPDVLIACMHWGTEYRSLPDHSDRELADWLISQGIDHVVGSHPHVLQPMETRADSLTPARHAVVYSLGNFLSNMSVEGTDGGALVKLELRRIAGITRLMSCRYALVWTSRPPLNGMRTFSLYPASFVQRNGFLRPAEANAMTRFLRHVRTLFTRHNKEVEEYFFE